MYDVLIKKREKKKRKGIRCCMMYNRYAKEDR